MSGDDLRRRFCEDLLGESVGAPVPWFVSIDKSGQPARPVTGGDLGRERANSWSSVSIAS
ncbi:MAG TPA: hypothetical protein VFE12_04065 [Acetobacteraceae bacterium]|jgi:hypothetical protein|nr:hypothetical protein [Acetobacteraceae bacterium]